MDALIIAAGRGKRIDGYTRTKPKPLVPIFGKTLIERTILTAKSVGIKRFVIVIGYKGDMIKEYLGNGSKYGVKIDYIENNEWEKGNGISILKAKGKIKGKFLLLMSDHIFDPNMLKKFIKKSKNSTTCVLCVDRKPKKNIIDIREATKVRVYENKIQHIGKKLHMYNAVDCGIFILNDNIFKAIEKAIKKNKTNLSDAIEILAKEGKIEAFDISNHFWIDIDTFKDYKIAKKILEKKDYINKLK